MFVTLTRQLQRFNFDFINIQKTHTPASLSQPATIQTLTFFLYLFRKCCFFCFVINEKSFYYLFSRAFIYSFRFLFRYPNFRVRMCILSCFKQRLGPLKDKTARATLFPITFIINVCLAMTIIKTFQKANKSMIVS